MTTFALMNDNVSDFNTLLRNFDCDFCDENGNEIEDLQDDFEFILEMNMIEFNALRFFWAEVKDKTGFDILKSSIIFIPLNIVERIYELAKFKHIEANRKYYISHKTKKTYMKLYDNILRVLENARSRKKAVIILGD